MAGCHCVQNLAVVTTSNTGPIGRATSKWWLTRGTAVEGDVDHPARLGDQIVEHVTIAGAQGSGTWTVVECEPPRHLALETTMGAGRLRISYQLSETGTGGTRFQRDLDFPELGPQVSAAMEAQSAEGATRLADLVQREIPAPG